MSVSNAFRKSFERGASPFMRLTLSPLLLFFGVILSFPLMDAVDARNTAGAVVGAVIVLLCLFGILALWGVPHAGRIVAGFIAVAYGWYMADEIVLNFDGDWGFGGARSEASPMNSILGFIAIGLPCLIYAVFGRFTIHEPKDDPEWLEDFDEEEEESGHPLEEKD